MVLAKAGGQCRVEQNSKLCPPSPILFRCRQCTIKMKQFTILICFLLGFACQRPKPNEETVSMDFGSFPLEAPKSWKKLAGESVDSYVGLVVIDSTDTLHFDYGWYSSTLAEAEPLILERALLKNMREPVDTNEFNIVESRLGIDVDDFRKNNVSWDTIDGRKAKIIFPRRSGRGMTGVYISNVWEASGDITRFNLYGENLKTANEKTVLEVLQTLKFRPR